MCPSSRFFCFLLILAATPVQAELRSLAPVMSHPPAPTSRAWTILPTASAVAPGSASGTASQLARSGSPAGQRLSRLPSRLRVGPDSDRSGRRTGGGRRGVLIGEYGYGLDASSFGVIQPQLGAGGGPDNLPAPPLSARFASPPACPLVIKIGHGLLHPAKTRIVSGHPGCI